MTAEDKIHWSLLVAIAALAGAVFIGRPPASESARSSDATQVAPTPPREVKRHELDSTIRQLESQVQRSGARVREPLALSLALQGLGQAGLIPAPQPVELGSLLSNPVRSPAEDDPIAALAISIEGGLSLERELPVASGTAGVQQLLERALDTNSPRGEPNGWELELLSLATLRGLDQYRERLAHLTQATLRHLDLRSRAVGTRPGSGELDRVELRRRADAWRAAQRSSTAAAHELLLSMAAFRAVGVLAEPALDLQALLHLKTLLFRYGQDRALFQYLVASAVDPAEKTRARLEAIEYFGRLEQALYGAHLAFRRRGRPGPEPRTAAVMRRAAGDLIEHYRELERAGVFEAPAPDAGVLRAAVHALRGLRTARSATG